MKAYILGFKSIKIWFILLLLSQLFFSFLIWLINPDGFKQIVIMMIIFSLLILSLGYFLNQRNLKRIRFALQCFLNQPNETTKQQLLDVTDKAWHPFIQTLTLEMQTQHDLINTKQLELQNYQEFIVAWTHQIKTPLALETLILNNHKEDMSPYVYNRMSYANHAIENNVEKILYYARLHVDHIDHHFEKIELEPFILECLLDFQAMVAEKQLQIDLKISPVQVISDRKALKFILSQLLTNAVKYAANEHGLIRISCYSNPHQMGKVHLVIYNNGKTVAPEDLPFLFDKGFTGSVKDRENSTGIGLYLVKRYATALSLDVNLNPRIAKDLSFNIELIFPAVKDPTNSETKI